MKFYSAKKFYRIVTIWRLYVLTIVLTITEPASGQPNKELCAYLTANSWQEDIHNIANVSFTDSAFYKNQFFLLGEFHGIKYSYDFQAAFLDNLKKRTDIRYYVAELDNCSAYFINKYLRDYDTAMLLKHFEWYKGTFFYSREYINCFIALGKLNREYPTERQVRVIGVDIQHQPAIAFEYIKEVFGPIYSLQKEVLPFMETIFNTPDTAWNTINLEDFISSGLKEIKANYSVYRLVFANKIKDLEFVIRNISNRYFVYAHRQQFNQLRDSIMFDNFSYLYNENNIGTNKMFGFFGREHTFQFASSQTNWFISLVKRKMNLSGIVSTVLFYTNCNQMLPSSQARSRGIKMKYLYFFGKWANDDGSFSYTKGIDALTKCQTNYNSISLFSLATFNSPYLKLKDLVTGIAEGHSTTDYFQYAILLRDSPASTPLSNPEIKE